jgi:hypothetical protein
MAHQDPYAVNCRIYDSSIDQYVQPIILINQDGFAAGNTAGIGVNAFGYTYNDKSQQGDRLRGNVPSAPLATQAATAATRQSADLTNYNGRGILLHVKIANYAGAATFTPQIQWKDSDGNYVTIWTAAAALSANGDFTYLLYPGAVAGTGSALTAISGIALPRTFRLNLNYTGNGTTDKADTTVDMDNLV